MISRQLGRERLQNTKQKENKKKKITGVRRLRGTESVGAKLALLQENAAMMQRAQTIPKRRLVITPGKVRRLREDFQGRLGAGRNAEGKKEKVSKASAGAI